MTESLFWSLVLVKVKGVIGGLELKEKITDAAAKSFSKFGYKGTTMEQVARIANVGKGTIYQFFQSKEELFQFILDRLIMEMKQVAVQSTDPEQPFYVNLNRTLNEMMQYRKQHELFVMIVRELREIGTGPVREGLQQVEDSIVQFIANELEQGIARGDVKPCEPKLVAFVMLKTYTSLVFEWEQQYEQLESERITSLFDLIFSEGLKRT